MKDFSIAELNSLHGFLLFESSSSFALNKQDVTEILTTPKNKNLFRLLFLMYDHDRDGYISNNDLFNTLVEFYDEDTISNDNLIFLISSTIKKFDLNKDGKLNFLEFCEAICFNKFL